MRGLLRLTVTEFTLFWRDGAAVFSVLALPIGFLLIFGSMVSGGGPSTDPRASEGFFSAMSVSLSMGMLALFTIPTYLGTYREKGILRRLSVTPVHPAMLLTAQLVVNTVMAVLGVTLVIVVGNVILDIGAPRDPAGFALAFVLGVSALFAVGLLIAAVAPSGRAAGAIGPLLFFPLLFFAGAWMPRDRMPDLLARIGDFTPLTATMESLHSTWQGHTPQALDLAVLAATTVIVGIVAARVFRWE